MAEADGAVKGISDRIIAQLEEARDELNRARTELDIMLGELVGDLHANLGRYIVENLKREIRKRPEQIDRVGQDQLEQLKAEIEQVAREESNRIVESLRNSPEWYDPDVVFLESQTSVWKTIQASDAPVNKTIKKHGISPITMRNWNWLGDHLADLAGKRYPAAKRVFIEKSKLVNYLESRLSDETVIGGALEKLDSL